MPHHVLVSVDVSSKRWVLFLEQERSSEPLFVQLDWLIDHDEVLEIVKDVRAEDLPVRPMVQIVIPDDPQNRKTESIQTTAALCSCVQCSHVDRVPVLEEVTEERNVAWLDLFDFLDEPIDVIKTIQVVLITIVSCPEVDIGKTYKLRDFADVFFQC